MNRSSLRGCLLAALLSSFAPQLSATTILTFSGLSDGEQLLNFYNGGTGSLGSSFYDYGITFSPGTIAYVDSDVGGTGNFANAPSPWGAIFSTTGFIRFNVSPGFTEALRFYYVTYNGGPSGSVSIFSGLNETGQLLSSATLNPPTQNCPGNPQGSYYGCWQLVELPFSGTARSVVFQSPVLKFGLDSLALTLPALELTQTSATPEPASFALVCGALIGAWMLRIRLRRY